MLGFSHSSTFWPVRRLSGSGSLTADSSPFSRCHLAPQFLWYWPCKWSPSQLGYTYHLSDFIHPCVSWHGPGTSPLWEGRESVGCYLSSNASDQPCLPGELPVGLQNILLPIFKHRLHSTLASKLHISWDSVGCSVCSSEDQLSVPVGCMHKWVQLPHTSPPPSQFWKEFLNRSQIR